MTLPRSQSLRPVPEGHRNPEILQNSYRTITADDRFAHFSQEVLSLLLAIPTTLYWANSSQELRLEDYRQNGQL